MYGDCQVMSTSIGGGGGGGVVGGGSSENFYSSSPQQLMQNPNYNFMPFNPFTSLLPAKDEDGLMMMRGKDDILESGSGSEQQDKSGNELETFDTTNGEINTNPKKSLANKKKRYHRHTARQIQEMEALFKECPHPDDKQRTKLSQDLGLKPRQVKFWFQNRRTQIKAQQDRAENVMLRTENDALKNENYRLQSELRSVSCPNCGGPAMLGGIAFEEIRLENARLRDELERVCCIASRYSGHNIQPMAAPVAAAIMPPPPSLELDMNAYSRNFAESSPMPMEMMLPPFLPEHSSFPEAGFLLPEEEKSLATELALSSMEELTKMCKVNKPLWVSSENGKEVLNVEEHAKMFPWRLNVKQQQSNCDLRAEASRDSAVVIMNSITLVDSFLDPNKWMELFPSIVARAKTLQVICPGVSGPSGSLILMYAEFQVVSPLVPTRETYFLRYVQQNIEEGTWAIVDFPVDSFHEQMQSSSFPMYKRRSSGCLIQDMPNGYSTVTWVEHGEADEKPVHQIFSNFVYNGLGFGASRWLALLQRQCQRFASLMARNITDLGGIPSPEARKNTMRLAQNMVRSFCVRFSSSCGQSWTALSESAEETVRITTRKLSETGQPSGIVLCGATTIWLPYSHYQVFDLLRDERKRTQLEVLSNGNELQEVAHIANGSHPGNCISLLRINVSSNSAHDVEFLIQESSTDKSGSLVVYSTIDVESLQLVMGGEDPSCITLMPLGFSIVPTTTTDGNSEDSSSGCLLTVGLQVLASSVPTAKLSLSSVSAINSHLINTVNQIAAALDGNNSNNNINFNDNSNSNGVNVGNNGVNVGSGSFNCELPGPPNLTS